MWDDLAERLVGFAESAMTDTAVLTGPGGAPVLDEVTGSLGSGAGPVKWSGRCRVRGPSISGGAGGDAIAAVGDQQVTTMQVIVCVPLTTPRAEPGDRLTVTDSRNPLLVGRVLIITADPPKTYAAQRELFAVDNQG